MPQVAIPDPSVVVLIGAAGSGKSTFAARHFRPEDVLSSDAFRELIAGDEADQRATGAAFARLHRELSRRLARGRLAVIDATNLRPHARRSVLGRARRAGVPAVAIVFDLPRNVVQARNAARRPRVVDPEVVDRHLDAVRLSVHANRLAAEGFDAIVVLRSSDEIDALDVVVEGRKGPTPAGEPPQAAPDT